MSDINNINNNKISGDASSKEYYNHALNVARKAITLDQKQKKLGTRLLSLFGLRVNPGTNSSDNTLVHGVSSKRDIEKLTTVRDPRTGSFRQIPEKLNGTLGTLFDAYLSDTFETIEMLKEKEERYNELDFMYLNDPFISDIADLMADEAAQIDQQDNIISIDSPSTEQTEAMYTLLDEWGISQKQSRDTMFNLSYYGDALWGLKVTEQGVINTKPLSPRSLKERLEFNPLKTQERLELLRNSWLANNNTRDRKINTLIQAIDADKLKDYSDIFETFLFGYDIAGTVVPPWNAYHFRLNATQSEFFPYGKSNFIRALSPFKQMSSTFILQAMARVMSFPVREMKVKTKAGMTESDIFNKINIVREKYEGQGYGFPDVAADPYSLLQTIWTADDLMTLNVQSTKVEMDFVGDLEILVDRLITASGAPKGYLDQAWGGWGNSALSLTEQHKPFARRVFSLQSAYLEGVADLFRLHFAITGQFDYTEAFQLSMNFPNSEVSDERQKAKTASLGLAEEVMALIQNAMGIKGPLPFEIAKDILINFTFLKDKDIEKWLNFLRKKDIIGTDSGDTDSGESESMGDLFGENGLWLPSYLQSSLKLYEADPGKKEKIINRYLEVRKNLHFKARVKYGLNEGTSNGKHYLLPHKINSSDPLSFMFEVIKKSKQDKVGTLKG